MIFSASLSFEALNFSSVVRAVFNSASSLCSCFASCFFFCRFAVKYSGPFSRGTCSIFCATTCSTFYLTYTGVSENGIGVNLRTTKDWKHIDYHGMIFSPTNKDAAIFEEKINGRFYALHRPSGSGIGGNYIWLAESHDGLHWGNHQCILKTRMGMWDSARIGAGAAPIKTEKGWLEIYHGANAEMRYCLGAFLMDLNDPSKVIGRTCDPIMVPLESYELSGFFGHVVFTNGHVVNGDELTIYYGAADEFICGARFSIQEILLLMEIGNTDKTY